MTNIYFRAKRDIRELCACGQYNLVQSVDSHLKRQSRSQSESQSGSQSGSQSESVRRGSLRGLRMEERDALALGIALISELCLARLPLPPLLARARVRVVLALAVGAPRLVHREELRLALPPRLLE